ncbi:MAG: hypothetical protein R6V05_04825 [Candidatus Brocadiia bacterium]
MGAGGLTPEEFEAHLQDLHARLTAYVERGEGDYERLRREAGEVLSLADEFPDVYARHREVEGLVAAMLAREKQKDFMAWNTPSEAPGCMFGWLFGGKGR